MKVLLLKCNYRGAYDSFDEFYRNIERIFIQASIEVIYANNKEEAINILELNKVDFSINVGQYSFYVDGKPLYEVFKTMNYQWIIDNPLRYKNCDFKSKYNRLIYIDGNFSLFPKCYRADYISMSLPYPEYKINKTLKKKGKIILAPMKIKDILDFEGEIEKSEDKILLWDFLHNYDYDESFNRYIVQYIKEQDIKNMQKFFEIANGYIRVKKRVRILQSINKHEVYVLSERPDSISFNKNIHFLGKKSYYEYRSLQNEIEIVLNSNPNYDMCIHDRVSGGVMNGNIILSDRNDILDEINMPMCFTYSNLCYIDKYIDEINNRYEIIHKNQVNCLLNIKPCADIIVNNFYKFK